MKAITLVLLFSFTTLIGETYGQKVINEIPAEVYFIRATGAKAKQIAFRVFVDNKLACKINEKKYSVHQISSGKHEFSAQFKGSKIKKRTIMHDVVLEADHTYYYHIKVEVSGLGNRPYLELLDREAGEIFVRKFELDNKCF